MAKHKRTHKHSKADKMGEDSKGTKQAQDTDAVLADQDKANRH